MAIRPGHHRPLGTVARMRFTWLWPRRPQLGDIACQTSAEGADDEHLVRRAYRVVGIEEGRDAQHFVILGERVEWGTLPPTLDPDAFWTFYNTPRGGR